MTLLQIGYYPILRSWNYSMVSSESWRLYWNPQPGASLKCQGKTIPLNGEQVVLIPPFTVFSTYSQTDFSHFFMHFHAVNPYDHVCKQPFVIPAQRLSAELKAVLDTDARPVRTPFACLRLAIAALLALPQEAFLPESLPGHDPLVQQALELFKSTPYSLTNEEICTKLRVSTGTFYQRFKRETGLSPARYQLNKRLEKAAHLLMKRNLPIKAIAEQAGFADRYHFSKAFKAKFHLTPVDFRRQNTGL